MIIFKKKSLQIIYSFKIKILIDLLLGIITSLTKFCSIDSKNPTAIINQGFLTDHAKNVMRGEHTEERRTIKINRFAQVMDGTKITGHSLVQTTIRTIQKPCHGTKAAVLAEDSSLTRETTNLIGLRINKNKFLTPLKSRKSSADRITQTKQIITTRVNNDTVDV